METSTRLRKYILLVLFTHLLVLFVVYFNIPILRQVLMFAYLAFFPGFLLLIVLKMENLDLLKTVLFSVGLSIALLMFVGFATNEIYPILGIIKPLSTIPLLLTMSGLTLSLFFLGVRRNAVTFLDTISISTENLADSLIKFVPFAFLPIIAVTGAIYRDFAVPLLILLVAAAFVLSILSNRIVPANLYPILLFAICLALALQFTLMSQHIMGNDAPLEYRVYNLTALNGQWNPLTNGNSIEIFYTAMLSITILPTIFSVLLNLNGELLFKLLFPIVFSLIPIVLYKLLREQGWKSRAALMAAIFFASSPLVFYGVEPLSVNRQIVGEFFLLLSVFLILESGNRSSKRSLLLIIFGVALVVSHYSLTFIYLGFLIFMVLASKIFRKTLSTLNFKFILLMFLAAFGWYVTYATPLLPQISSTLLNIVNRFSTDFSNPTARSSDLFVSHPISNISSSINWVLFISVHGLIVLGLLVAVFRPKLLNVGFRHRLVLFFSGILLVSAFVVPNFAPVLNFSRFYAITMLFLAPCFVLGGESLPLAIQRVARNFSKEAPRPPNLHWKTNVTIVLIAILASAYFLSQSGFVNYVTGGSILSLTLEWDKTLNLNMTTSPEPLSKVSFYNAYTPNQDVVSAKWLGSNVANNSVIFGDLIGTRTLNVFGFVPYHDLYDLGHDARFVVNSYVYLRTFNVENGFIIPSYSPAFTVSSLNYGFDSSNVIYSNGESFIYRTVTYVPS